MENTELAIVPQNLIYLPHVGVQLQFRKGHATLFIKEKLERYSAEEFLADEALFAELLLQKGIPAEVEGETATIDPSRITKKLVDGKWQEYLSATFLIIRTPDATDETEITTPATSETDLTSETKPKTKK